MNVYKLLMTFLLVCGAADLAASKEVGSGYEKGLLRRFRTEQKKERPETLSELYRNDGAQYGELCQRRRAFNESKSNILSFQQLFIPSIILSEEMIEENFRKQELKNDELPEIDDIGFFQDFDEIDKATLKAKFLESLKNLLEELKDEKNTIEQKKQFLLNAPISMLKDEQLLTFVANFYRVYKQLQYADKQQIGFFKALLLRGVKIATIKIDTIGNTFLHLAAAGGSDTIIDYLLAIGSDINAKNNNGYTALELALKESMFTTVIFLLNRDAVSRMGALLSWAIEKREGAFIRDLIHAGVPILQIHIDSMGKLGPKTQNFLKKYFVLASADKSECESIIIDDLIKSPNAKKNLQQLLVIAGLRGEDFINTLYDTIMFYFDLNERKQWGCTYNNAVEFLFDVIKNTKNISQRKKHVVKLFNICTGELFEAGESLTDVEVGVKNLVEDVKLFDLRTRNELKDFYSSHRFKRQLKQRISQDSNKRFVDIAINFKK